MNPRKKAKKSFSYSRKIRSCELTRASAPPIASKTTAPATKLKIKLDKDGVIKTIIC